MITVPTRLRAAVPCTRVTIQRWKFGKWPLRRRPVYAGNNSRQRGSPAVAPDGHHCGPRPDVPLSSRHAAKPHRHHPDRRHGPQPGTDANTDRRSPPAHSGRRPPGPVPPGHPALGRGQGRRLRARVAQRPAGLCGSRWHGTARIRGGPPAARAGLDTAGADARRPLRCGRRATGRTAAADAGHFAAPAPAVDCSGRSAGAGVSEDQHGAEPAGRDTGGAAGLSGCTAGHTERAARRLHDALCQRRQPGRCRHAAGGVR